jgi:hypothetical protein
MSPGPVHARQRRRRLLLLVGALLAVTLVSPRLQDKVVRDDDDEGAGRAPVTHLARATEPIDMPTGIAVLTPNARLQDLFFYVRAPAHAAELEAQSPVPSEEVHYIALNHALLTGKQSVFWRPGSRLTVPLPDGSSFVVEIESTDVLGPGQFTSEGHIVGVEGGRALFAYSNGRFSARFEGLPQGDFQLRSLADPKGHLHNQFYAVETSLIPGCDGAAEVGQDFDGLWAQVGDGKAPVQPPVVAGDEIETLLNGQAIIDLLVVYTQSAREALGDADSLRAEIALGVAKINSDFRASAISARIRLVGTLELPLEEDHLAGREGDNYYKKLLERLADPRDAALAAVRAERDRVGADLVTLVAQRQERTTSGNRVAGSAYILREPRGYLEPFFAFSIIHSSFISGAGSVFSHEVGHNLGCGHARGDAESRTDGLPDGAYPYSYGYRFHATDTQGRTHQFRTIMAYEPGQRLSYFSNPRVTLPSAQVEINGARTTARFDPEPALGVADGRLAADNARTIERNAFQVANYRVSADYSAAGRLVNVSTRAFVGTGPEVMIGGFVVTGSGRKPVLVRAVGPTLLTVGLKNVLADPVLKLNLHRGDGRTVEVASNDDWWRADGNGLLNGYAALNRRASGLPLVEGSADAALLVDLEPGVYTATVSGKNQGTGEALFEVYEFGASSANLINLSTRAHGTNAQPIIAGFVVEADKARPNERKRVFIRVRGPSLDGFGFTAMADPVLQLFSERGEMILENDDWDPPTTSGTETTLRYTTRGEVDQSSEQAVFEANRLVGGGPMRAVEPAVVVELPPGTYTLSVAPYANLKVQPVQVGQPGIAIVEVYELPGRRVQVEKGQTGD